MEEEKKPHKEAYNHSIRLLARKDYSRYKMETKLKEKGFDRNVANDVVEELVEKKYLREELYIESRVKGLIRKGWSYEKVIRHLEQERCSVTNTKLMKS